MGHFHNTQRTSRRREIERASGKRENEGEEVSTLLGGLARFSLWETFTLSGTIYTHTQEYEHTHADETDELGEKKKKKLRLQTQKRQTLKEHMCCVLLDL